MLVHVGELLDCLNLLLISSLEFQTSAADPALDRLNSRSRKLCCSSCKVVCSSTSRLRPAVQFPGRVDAPIYITDDFKRDRFSGYVHLLDSVSLRRLVEEPHIAG